MNAASQPGRVVGRPEPRWEDARLVRGYGRYLDDIRRPGMLEVAFVRSLYAHARLLRVDTDAARAHPDCKAVLTAQDMVGHFKPYWSAMGPEAPIRRADLYPLARDKVRWVGEPVAMVVAADRYRAEDVAELVKVTYDPLPAVVDPEKAAEPESPRLYEEWPDNLVMHQHFTSDAAAIEEAFQRAARVIRRRFRSNRHTAAPLETRGIVAEYDHHEEVLRIWIGHQDVHLVRITLAELLGLPIQRVHVISPDVGGAFGVKLPIYPEELAVAFAALHLGRPLKWVQDRREGLLGDTHAREAIVDAEMAFDSDARILALRCSVLSDAGAYGVAGRGPIIEGSMVAREMPGPYRIRHYAYDLRVVMTNKAPVATYRGVGIPIATFVMERMMDIAAAEFGLTPEEIRLRNLIRPEEMPWTTPLGHVYDTGRYPDVLKRALAIADIEGLRRAQAEARQQGRLFGIGIATMVEASARGGAFYGRLGMPVSGQESCVVKMDPSGDLAVYVGVTELGQGIRKTIAQVVSDETGVPLEHIRVYTGDTERTLYGGGSWASRGATVGGSAALLAARKLADKLRRIGAHLLEARPEDVELAHGEVRVKGAPRRSVPYRTIARTAYFLASTLPPGIEPGLEVSSHWEPEIPATFAQSAHVVALEVDPATGALRFLRWVAVDDAGRILNPALVEGQMMGAIAQGLGGAVYEHMIYDENGQLLTADFTTYRLPTCCEVPEVEIHHLETPSVHNPLGTKGMAEAGTSVTPGLLANAVSDALGVEVNELPLHPARIMRLLQQSRLPAADTLGSKPDTEERPGGGTCDGYDQKDSWQHT